MKLRSLNYYWRLCATFVSFCAFGGGGLFISIAIFPVLYLLPLKKRYKIKCSRYVVRFCFQSFIWLVRVTGVLTYEVHDVNRLKREGLFIVANHPTLIDVVFLIALGALPNCVVKGGVWKNPFMFFVVRASCFIQSSKNPEYLLQRCEKSLNEGDGMVLFPEGTRTDPDGEVVMRRGVSHIALRAKKDLTPVYITCEPITLTKKHRWYNIPLEKPPHFCIRVGKDIEINPFLDLQNDKAACVRRLTKKLKAAFAA